MALRNPTPEEENLILLLLSESDRRDLISSIDHLKVENMDDGEMGSLKLHSSALCDADTQRLFGAALSEYCFDDEDGVKVIATLNLDQGGHLFELDVWKTNFEKLIGFPSLGAQSGIDSN